MTIYISNKKYKEIVEKIKKSFPDFDESKIMNNVITIPMKFESMEDEINRVREVVRKAVNEVLQVKN